MVLLNAENMTPDDREFLVCGPPGCGKTSYIAKQTKIAAEKYGSDKVMVCSLTKAAALEAGGRDTGLSEGMVGTLHSHCFRALGMPRMAESKEGLALWNHRNQRMPLRVSVTDMDECGVKEFNTASGPSQKADMYLQNANLLRARKAPKLYWSSLVLRFYKKWKEFKKEHDLLDFADLIEQASTKLIYAPGNPNVIFADEAQDLSCAEHELLVKWGRGTDRLVIVADRDQSLYFWRGSSEHIADPSRFPSDQLRVLTQSYRVPKAVHARAVTLIEHHSNRRNIEYKPTEVEGRVYRSTATFKNVSSLDKIIDKAMAENKSVMVLASCSFMLDPLVAWFRQTGVPYGNQYSNRWSPLRRSASQMYDYLKPSREHNPDPAFWTLEELKNVINGMVKGRIFRYGMSKRFYELPENISSEDLAIAIREVVLPDVLPEFMEFDPDRFQQFFTSVKHEAMNYPKSIVKRFSREHIVMEPSVTVGTIHSVKGGAADVVILFPDLSMLGYKQYMVQGFGARDAILRLFYVGMTRSREDLIICNPCGGSHAREVLSGT